MARKDEQMKEQKDFQEKLIAYRVLEARIDSLLKQRELLANKLVEIQTTLESIDEIEKSKDEIIFPLGSNAYMFGRAVDKDKIIVEVGAGIALEKNVTEARDILNKRKGGMENALTTLQRNIQEASDTMQTLEPEIQEMIDRQQQAQQQTQQRIQQQTQRGQTSQTKESGAD
ncbi:prefoldin subunit alpha [Candidatus Wolfebacteria bacterium RIFCSPLOWO2_01_FULL_47_17b]|uniref:Prefoldin subunit alpha n=1 Tax=Candidatus Wolfebacteria bacterium RIFCSPLOWO2_01_FULL_47_17b TaxID=1802558 RepID=A0A1F8DWT4_9BACT|nr:MAG: prefoldin subunit alpha [Candidatus Wolfebacteria bacterium RIFCSPLOWO2_01_FULL_47_17b]